MCYACRDDRAKVRGNAEPSLDGTDGRPDVACGRFLPRLAQHSTVLGRLPKPRELDLR